MVATNPLLLINRSGYNRFDLLQVVMVAHKSTILLEGGI